MCAKMYPSKLVGNDVQRAERLIYNSLERNLPDDYHVIYSKKITKVINNIVHENEADFVIYNRDKGILVIEVKDSRFHFDQNENKWVHDYRDNHGKVIYMKKGGPWAQASIEKANLYNLIKSTDETSYIINNNKLKVLFAVWVCQASSQNNLQNWPGDSCSELTLFSDDIKNPLPAIERIFNLEYRTQYSDNYTGEIKYREPIVTKLTQTDEKALFEHIFFPEFIKMTPIAFNNALYDNSVIRFLDEQLFVLDFTENQKSVAINGAAGTGKTLIAVEKAKRLAKNGDKVLFLCFNSALREDLCKKNNGLKNVDFKTLSKFIKEDLGVAELSDYDKAAEKLNYYCDHPEKDFKYKHIIIDEGQDFSHEKIENDEILFWLYSLVNSRFDDSCFYIFYDELQRVNGAQKNELPDFIKNAEAKVSLKTNCRNSTNIALASLKPIFTTYTRDKIEEIKKDIENNPNLSETQKTSFLNRKTCFLQNNMRYKLNNTKGFIDGNKPKMYFIKENTIEKIQETVNKLIDKYLNINKTDNEKYQPEDITVLTCMPESRTIFKEEKERRKWFYKDVTFMSTNTYKGLENEFIILVEVNQNTFKNYAMDYYVGASRAKNTLAIVTDVSEEQSKSLIQNWLNEDIQKGRKNRNVFAEYLKCSGEIVKD